MGLIPLVDRKVVALSELFLSISSRNHHVSGHSCC